MTGSLPPGERLLEAEVSAALGVSRTPVRDAFATLHHEGLVTLRHHLGAVVVGIGVSDIVDLYSLRRSLESLAVNLAAVRATPDDLETLKVATIGVIAESATLRPRQFAEADVAFHDGLYRAAHHDRLYACWSNVRPHIFRFLLTRNIANSDYRTIFEKEHTALADAVANRDAALAAKLTEHHLEGSYQRLVQHYRAMSRPSGERRSTAAAAGPSRGTPIRR